MDEVYKSAGGFMELNALSYNTTQHTDKRCANGRKAVRNKLKKDDKNMSSIFKINLKSFFKSKNKKKYFTSYILVIFCLLSFSLGAFLLATGSLKNTFDNNNTLMINSVTKSLNEVFKKVDDVYKTLENYTGAQPIFEDANLTEYITKTGNEEIDKINESVLLYDFIEEIVFVKRDKDYVISSSGAYSKSDFFNLRYNSEKYGEVFFDNLLTDYLNVKIIPATTYKNIVKFPTEDPRSLFAFVKTYGESDMNIIIFVSEAKFIKGANLDIIDGNLNLKIYDYNDTVVYSNNDKNYIINTKNISKDFESCIINRGLKKYYVNKSNYNYFYYVAEIQNHILASSLFAILFMLLGLIVSVYLLIRKIEDASAEEKDLYNELFLDEEDADLKEVKREIKNLKKEISDNKNKVNTMGDEIKNSIFLKMINSTSFYTRNLKTVELTFNNILDKGRLLIVSAETIKESNRLPKIDVESMSNYFSKKGIDFVHIEEKTRKNIYVLALGQNISAEDIEKDLINVLNDLRVNGIEVLVCYSKEFKDLSGLNDAFCDIKICRDYRGINDKITVLNVKNIDFNNNISLPINFKEELAGKIMANEEEKAKEYVKEIFNLNISNNIPLSKFEFMLRQLLSTVTEAVAVNKKGVADFYELEQMFLSGIENLKDNFDVNGIINSFINLIHLSISMCDTKKSTLNRTDVIRYINSHYTEDLYLEKIATEFSTTPKYFSNYFKKEFSVGFNEYLTQVRISHAKQILCDTDLSLAEVSMKSGYLNQATFTVAFKKTVGLPPGKYREMNKKAP